MRKSLGAVRPFSLLIVLLAGLLTAASAALLPPAAAAPAAPAYELAGKCFRLSGKSVPGGHYYAKAAALGQFLFSDKSGRLLTADGGSAVLRTAPSNASIWSVRHDGDRYRLTSVTAGKIQRTVSLTAAQGCRNFPEAQLNVDGGFGAPVDAQGRLLGFADGHAHLMAEQFLGGGLHCGKPFSPLGITVALKDCADHAPDGWPALSEHILSEPGPHSAYGWPSFTGWPKWYSLTHEQTYYRWIERAWRGGLRVINNYYVQNRVLCELYPLGDEPCDEMESVRIQHRRLARLQNYIDAQAGGPGKGFFRIVTDAAQMRSVIAAGKLAVTLGIEISEPFGCTMIHDVPQCTRGDIDRGMDELKAMGVRQMILTHKFDNAFGGAHIDSDFTGLAVQTGQVIATGRPWQTEPCRTPRRDHQAPFDAPGRCNARGLTDLGAYAVNAAIDRNLVIDIDHLSVKSADRVLSIAAGRDYPGLTSSHTWTDPANYRRILSAGGAVGLYASGAERTPGDKHSESFVDEWRKLRQANGGAPVGITFGPDMNGLGKQAPPRPGAKKNPVRYPFRAENGALMSRQVSGTKSFDVNVDGTAHYGLIPDWIESLRLAAGADGNALVDDMYHGASAKLAMWERTEAHTR
ncbi:putative sphingolipid ceramide N-deacylase [Gordonia hirsuta DSM 44140 = NBRC 16056]|uniref:Putative sphingolipid ceramide N-deacylase n=1 Tax=Gordonia hirsuta DSM 44140 = NBRC 16056 TaxID=1121927 RepID=L7LC32_9ACTN|nr:membrane dipeptidase [Gordonia hirsuta]GAC57632.1 putative sphingolipid ceramide N-deacylase [Gordonia hirsuta DSM 44140 = NBRC 16056]